MKSIDKKMYIEKKRIMEVLFFLILIIFTYIFFRVIHPLIVFDTDDWWYIYFSRKAIPMPGTWNPARVLPEILMPLVSEIASYTLYPITNDFIGSLATVHALVVSLFVIIYIYSFYKLCRDVFCDSVTIAMSCSLLFYMLHFLVFRVNENANIFLFNAHNVTCYFYYVIPVMLNASLVMWMLNRKWFNASINKATPFLKGVYYLLIYLAVFSNLYSSVIIVTYAVADILIDLKKGVRSKIYQIISIALWIISAVFEMFGGRAKDVYDANITLFGELKKTLKLLFTIFSKVNTGFLLITIIAFGVLVYFVVVHRENSLYYKLIIAGFMTLAFEVLLCAVTGFARINRPDVLIAFFFFFFVLLCALICTFLEEHTKLLIIAPIVLLVIFFEINTEGVTFIEANTPNINSKIAEQISRDIVKQITSAEQNGESEITLYVPKWNSDDNWPHGMYGADRFAKALYKHGVLNKKMVVHMVPSEEMYLKYMR